MKNIAKSVSILSSKIRMIALSVKTQSAEWINGGYYGIYLSARPGLHLP